MSNWKNLDCFDALSLINKRYLERITSEQNIMRVLISGGQNRMPYPNKLFFKKNRLYEIKEGHLIVKKQKEFWTGKMWDPWYFKSND